MKIIYFTAGRIPTTNEKNEIAALNALAVAPFEVVVRSAADSLAYGAGNEACDYAAGTPPEAYEETPVFDIDNPPESGLPATNAIVADGQVLTLEGDGDYEFTVANGQITAIAFTPEA